MGTTCEIARIKDGIVKQIHISYDGYLGGVGLVLFRHYDTQEKVDALFSHGTAATSLEADPEDMAWSHWEDRYEGMPVADYIGERRRFIEAYAERPHDPENINNVLLALAEMNPFLKPVLEPAHQTREVGAISSQTDVRDLPEETRKLLPGIIARLFASTYDPDYRWEHAYGSLAHVVDHHATPKDFDFEAAWGDGYLGDYVFAHGKWCYTRNASDLTAFIDTGESPNIITREFLMSDEGGCNEEDFESAPARPFNEMIGIFHVNDEGFATLDVNGNVWSVTPGPDLRIEGDISDWQDKKVRILHGVMAVSFSTSNENSQVIEAIKLERVDA